MESMERDNDDHVIYWRCQTIIPYKI